MSGSDFEVKGLDDLSEKLLSAIEEFPGTAEKGLVTLGNKLKKECVKNTPEGSTGKLKKGWKHKVEGYDGSELTYELVNKHPVHHLLNNGHVKKTPGGALCQMLWLTFFKFFERRAWRSGLLRTKSILLR